MLHGRTTLSKFIIEEQRKLAGGAELIALVNDIQTACKYIASAVARGALTGARGSTGNVNVQGEEQKPLDVIANDIMLGSCEWGGYLAGMVSEEMEAPYPIPAQYPRGRYLLVFDPLDGSSNLDVNVTVGHDLFGAARAGGRHRPEARRLPATGHAAGLRRLRVVRAVGDDRDHARHRRARLHARSGNRRLHPDAPEPHHRRGHAGVRGQRLEPAVLGAAGEALRRGVPRRQDRRAGQGLQHALDRVAGRRGAPDPDARRPVHVSEGHPRPRQAGTPAPAL